jgi:glycerol-3-phosphate dehydrogenase
MDVCTLSKPTEKLWPRYGRLLVEGNQPFPDAGEASRTPSPHSIFRPFAGLQISCDVFAAGYPFIEEEVEYCCGEYCRSVKDMLSLRMRLAYINSEAAKEAVPRVADIMAEKLGQLLAEIQPRVKSG